MSVHFSRSPISIAAAAIYMASQASSNKKTARGLICGIIFHIKEKLFGVFIFIGSSE